MGLTENLATFDASIMNVEDCHKGIVEVFRRYIEMREDYYDVVASWIIAAKNQDQFETFPYLYLNAMKGSGKTRFLKLTMFILDGFVTTNVTDAVLFRERLPVAIDEAENVDSKDNANKRELLNSGYKKGSVVKRADKKTED